MIACSTTLHCEAGRHKPVECWNGDTLGGTPERSPGTVPHAGLAGPGRAGCQRAAPGAPGWARTRGWRPATRWRCPRCAPARSPHSCRPARPPCTCASPACALRRQPSAAAAARQRAARAESMHQPALWQASGHIARRLAADMRCSPLQAFRGQLNKQVDVPAPVKRVVRIRNRHLPALCA